MSGNPTIRNRTGKVEGKPGAATKVGSEWLGWRGTIAHPDSPAGGGWPGHFSRVRLGQREHGTLPSPWRRGPLQSIPLQGAPAPRPANLPPATNPRSLGVLKSLQNDLMDVNVDAKIVADGTGARAGAVTSFTDGTAQTVPIPHHDRHNKIIKFGGKFSWRGTVTIQTVYAAGVGPSTLSGYGRGTTDSDVRNRDITLGFHESCHRNDYVAYLQAHTLPDPPQLAIGMNVAEYNTAISTFRKELHAYFKAMKEESVANTDEVGHCKSTWVRTRTCFQHTLP
jgi:hypothetical protein